MTKALITLNEETEAAATKFIHEVIKSAQNGVTIFSAQAVLANILLDLNLTMVGD